MSALDTAISIAGGLSALALKLKVTPQVINNWRTRGVPPDRVLALEAATDGQITRYALRPDVFGADDSMPIPIRVRRAAGRSK